MPFIIHKQMHILKIESILSLVLLVVVALSSCEKQPIEGPEATDPETIEKPVQLKFTLKNPNSGKVDNAKEGYDEYNYLGFGYDVTGKHSHKTSVRDAVINTPSFVAEDAGRFDALRVLESSFKTIYATDALDFTRALTGGNTGGPYFGGSITHPFPDTDPRADQYIYGLYDSYVRYTRLTLYGRSNIYITYLTENFRADCRTLNPAALVRKYGTHVLLSLYTGAKLSLTFQAEYTGIERKKAVENSFRVGLGECFELFSGFLDPVDSTTFKDIANPVIVFEAIGGNPSKISIDSTSSSKPIVDRSLWANTISEDNARFVYFDGLENLLPISDLIEDDKKKKKVKTYIEKYIKTSEVRINP